MRAAHALHPLVLSVSLVGVLALASCAREGTLVVAPVDIAIASDVDGGTMPLVIGPAPLPSPLPTDHRCSARLHPSAIVTGAGCTLDEHISHGVGMLFFPCSGDGPVEAAFGEHVFRGKLTDSTFVLALATELDWDDGCHWETKQGLRGEWNREPTKRAKLGWTYTERPVSGANCLASCRATADLEIGDHAPLVSPTP